MSASPLDKRLSPQEIEDRREAILRELLSRDEGFRATPVRSVRQSTLGLMFARYDELFFDGFLNRFYGKLRVTISTRLTSAAGKFVYSSRTGPKNAEIRMSGDFLFRLVKGPFQLNGLFADTEQEAFLIVFEHELIHALEYAAYGKTGHSSRFKALAYQFFRHESIYHSLPTLKVEAAKNGLTVGSSVSFTYEGKTFSGTVSYVGKTATVMVPDARGGFTDKRGRRCAKYRVPLSLLKRK